MGCSIAAAGGLLPQSGGRSPTCPRQAAARGWLVCPCPNTAAASPMGLLPGFLAGIKDAFVLPDEENKLPRARAWHLRKPLPSSKLFDRGTCIIDAVCFIGLENPCN